MNLAASADSPPLQPPGAGLPKTELFVARTLLAFGRWRGDKKTFTTRFQRERAAIRQLTDGCDADSGARRVLIRRVPGMEDSSRYWSVWMTLDHLRIIHLSFARVIEALSQEIVPAGKANTAAVKPSPEASAAVIVPYEASCEALLAIAAATPDLKTKARFTHPWFGPLDAAGWYALAGTHLGIHREQIKRIVDGQAIHLDDAHQGKLDQASSVT